MDSIWTEKISTLRFLRKDYPQEKARNSSVSDGDSGGGFPDSLLGLLVVNYPLREPVIDHSAALGLSLDSLMEYGIAGILPTTGRIGYRIAECSEGADKQSFSSGSITRCPCEGLTPPHIEPDSGAFFRPSRPTKGQDTALLGWKSCVAKKENL